MSNIVTTMKIHNHLIVSTIQILNKSSLKNKKNIPDEIISLSREDSNSNTQWSNNDYFIDYDTDDCYSIDNNEREECEECDKLILKTLLNYGLCEMCLNRIKRKRVIKKRKNK